MSTKSPTLRLARGNAGHGDSSVDDVSARGVGRTASGRTRAGLGEQPPAATDRARDRHVHAPDGVHRRGPRGHLWPADVHVGWQPRLRGDLFAKAPAAPDPASIYSGRQLILVKTDGTTFPNGDAWKCVTCGVPAANRVGANLNFDYPEAFRDEQPRQDRQQHPRLRALPDHRPRVHAGGHPHLSDRLAVPGLPDRRDHARDAAPSRRRAPGVEPAVHRRCRTPRSSARSGGSTSSRPPPRVRRATS